MAKSRESTKAAEDAERVAMQNERLRTAIGAVLDASLVGRDDAPVVALYVLTTCIGDVLEAFNPDARAEIAARASDVIAEMANASIADERVADVA